MKKWEYKVVPVSLRVNVEKIKAYNEDRSPEINSIVDVLNKEGEEGWELVAIHTIPIIGEFVSIIAYLKR